MKLRLIALLLISAPIGAFLPPVVAPLQEFSAARTRVYNRAPYSEQARSTLAADWATSNEQFLINYLKEKNVRPQALDAFLKVILSLQKNIIPNETYFDNLYWISNDGRELRRLSQEIKNSILADRTLTNLSKDPYFVGYLAAYLADKYEYTGQLRAAIALALPGSEEWIKQAFTHVPHFERDWCYELSILEKWLDAARRANDHFYEESLTLLLNALPKNNSLWMAKDSCIKDLLFHAARGNYSTLVQLMIDKGIDVNMQSGIDQTPLFAAVTAENVGLVKMLMDAGARSDIESIYHETPLDYAKTKPASERKEVIIQLLTKKNKRVRE
ncbi:hypothetical protein BH09DEP1_BH09DEP1_6570 [soil metagenome]